MSVPEVLALAGVVLLGAMAPGPDFAVVLRHALHPPYRTDPDTIRGADYGCAHGAESGAGVSSATSRRPAAMAAVGIAAGVGTWAVVAAVGLAGLLAASATAFTVVKLAGAVYLVWLGLRGLRAAIAPPATPTPRPAPGRFTSRVCVSAARHPVRAAFTEALVTNLLNPKAAVFFMALWPQFLPSGAGAGSVVVMVTVTTAVTLVWFLALGSALAVLAHALTRRIRQVIDTATGLVLIALGVRVATQP